MKRLSLRKISALGLVLMTASVVTAAVFPSTKKVSVAFAANGSITMGDDNNCNSLTCTATNGILTQPCNNTVSRGILAVSGFTAALGNPSKSNCTSIGDNI